jgi:ABC-type Fe3+-siderophore transport system permease subunit
MNGMQNLLMGLYIVATILAFGYGHFDVGLFACFIGIPTFIFILKQEYKEKQIKGEKNE